MTKTSVITRLSAAGGALALAATVVATPSQAATRAGGGIAWEPQTCELAIRNATDGPVDLLVETDVHEHPGMVLATYQEPLVEYTGEYTRSKLLARVADMPDRLPSLTVPAGRVGSFAIPCDGEEQLDGLPTTVWVEEQGDQWGGVRWGNPYWPGHQHTAEGHVLLTVD